MLRLAAVARARSYSHPKAGSLLKAAEESFLTNSENKNADIIGMHSWHTANQHTLNKIFIWSGWKYQARGSKYMIELPFLATIKSSHFQAKYVCTFPGFFGITLSISFSVMQRLCRWRNWIQKHHSGRYARSCKSHKKALLPKLIALFFLFKTRRDLLNCINILSE